MSGRPIADYSDPVACGVPPERSRINAAKATQRRRNRALKTPSSRREPSTDIEHKNRFIKVPQRLTEAVIMSSQKGDHSHRAQPQFLGQGDCHNILLERSHWRPIACACAISPMTTSRSCRNCTEILISCASLPQRQYPMSEPPMTASCASCAWPATPSRGSALSNCVEPPNRSAW